MGVESACQEGAARGVAWRHRAVRPAGDRRTRKRGDVQPERHSDEGAYGAACVRRRQGRRRGRGREGEHQGARPVRGRDRRLAGGRLAVAGSVRGGRRGEDAPGDSRQLERDHEAAVPQRPGQPRSELRRRLGKRHRPDDRVHALRRRVYAAAASGGVWRSTDQRGGTGPRSTPACRGCPSARWRPTRRTARCWVGTGEANNASENQYGVGVFRLASGSGTWQQVGGAELNGAGFYRIVWINGYRLRRDQPRSVSARRSARRLEPALAAGAARRPSVEQLRRPSSFGHRRHRGAGHGGARSWPSSAGPATAGHRPSIQTTGSTSAPAAPGSFTGSRRPATSTRTTIGRTTFSVVQRLALRGRPGHRRPTTCVGQGVFVSQVAATRPGRGR